MEKGSVTLRVFFEDPFWIGLIERVSEGKMTVCKVTFGPEPREYDVRTRNQIPTGIKAFAGAGENREKVQKPAGERGSGGTPVSSETAKEKGKTSRTLKTLRYFSTIYGMALAAVPYCFQHQVFRRLNWKKVFGK